MITYILALTLIRPHQDLTAAQVRLRDLSKARERFESRVVAQPKYDMQEHIYSMPLDQSIAGLYPAGESSRRYLVYFNGRALFLLFQNLDASGRAHTRWRLHLKKASRVARFRGTISRLLRSQGAEVSGNTTAAERASLNAFRAFAEYHFDGPEGQELCASFVRPDGKLPPIRHFEGSVPLPITEDESVAMGLGKVNWPPEAKFTIR